MNKICTTCSYCGVGCQMEVDIDDNKVYTNTSNKFFNKNHLCIKGYTLPETLKKGRLLNVLYRNDKNQSFKKINYKKAINILADKIKNTKPQRIAFYSAGQVLSEDYYIANKLFKGFIGTNNVDSNSRTCISSALVALRMSIGDDYITTRMEEVLNTDLIIVAGANPANAHPIFFDKYIKKAKKQGKKLVVIDPIYTKTAKYSDLYIKINPGTDTIFNNCIIAYLIQQNKLKDSYDVLKNKFNNFDEFYNFYKNYDYKNYILQTGVNKELFKKFVNEYLLKYENIISVTAMGYNQSVDGVYKNISLINIHLLLDKIAKPGNGYLPETGQANAMGGREVSGLATLLAVHFDFNDENNIKKVADFWGTDKIYKKPGRTILEVLDAAENGEIDILIVMHTDPVYSLPNRNRTEKIFNKIPFVVEINAYEDTETGKFANLRIPAAPWGEKEGRQTNLDRKISQQTKYLTSYTKRFLLKEKIKRDWEIIKDLADVLGFKDKFDYKNVDEIYNEFIKMIKLNENFGNYSEIDIEKLKNCDSFVWKNENFDKKREFFTENKKANLIVTDFDYHQLTTHEYPLTLLTYRIKEHWNSAAKTQLVDKIVKKVGKSGWVAMSMNSVHKFLGDDVKDGTMVTIESKVGKVTLPLKIDNTIYEDCVAIPTFERRINYLVESSLFDPFSKQPAYNSTAVKIYL